MTAEERNRVGSGNAIRQRILEDLAAVRRRTLDLVAPLSERALLRQHSPLMSPIVWDLCHIGEFEHLWLVRKLGEAAAESELEPTFDATRTPRSQRGDLTLPDRTAALARLASIRRTAVQKLGVADLTGPDNPLLYGGFVYELVRQHEAQHQETIVQTILLMRDETYTPGSRREHPASATRPTRDMVHVPAGSFEMGAPSGSFSYDNERPRHRVETGAYQIGRFPVSNAEYLEFVAAGGYEDRMLWTEEGWSWKEEASLSCPQYWRIRDADTDTEPLPTGAAIEAAQAGLGAWRHVTALGHETLRPDVPVAHVCFHEAEAFARFSAARLPTEAEWEKAAAWDPRGGESRPYPWGADPPDAERANLDLRCFGAAPMGVYPSGRSAVGCEQMLGDCWEWTATRFTAYPGFQAYPYDEYSAVFYGPDYVVLRGGSWATDSGVARNTFRNWDYPIRRQILSGLRLARDA